MDQTSEDGPAFPARSMAEVRAWLDTLPDDHEFNLHDSEACLGGQYVRAHGYPAGHVYISTWKDDKARPYGELLVPQDIADAISALYPFGIYMTAPRMRAFLDARRAAPFPRRYPENPFLSIPEAIDNGNKSS